MHFLNKNIYSNYLVNRMGSKILRFKSSRPHHIEIPPKKGARKYSYSM